METKGPSPTISEADRKTKFAEILFQIAPSQWIKSETLYPVEDSQEGVKYAIKEDDVFKTSHDYYRCDFCGTGSLTCTKITLNETLDSANPEESLGFTSGNFCKDCFPEFCKYAGQYYHDKTHLGKRKTSEESASPGTTKRKRIKEGNNDRKILDLIGQYGGVDGSHHKQWVLDQIVRTILGEQEAYKIWVNCYNNVVNSDGEEEEYDEWDTGIAP